MGGFGNNRVMSIKAAYRRVVSGGIIYIIFVCLFSALLIVGIASGIHALFIAGSRNAYGTYREIPVAILISTYIFCCFLHRALSYFFDHRQLSA